MKFFKIELFVGNPEPRSYSLGISMSHTLTELLVHTMFNGLEILL